MKFSYVVTPTRLRAVADTIPAVTVRSRPNGLPMAIDPLPDAQAIGIAELGRRQRRRRVDLQHRDVGLGIAPDERGRELPGVGETHGDVLSVLDNVVVRQDVSRWIHNHARARRARILAGPALEISIVELVAEILAEPLLVRAGAAALGHRAHVHHRRRHAIGDRAEGFFHRLEHGLRIELRRGRLGRRRLLGRRRRLGRGRSAAARRVWAHAGSATARTRTRARPVFMRVPARILPRAYREAIRRISTTSRVSRVTGAATPRRRPAIHRMRPVGLENWHARALPAWHLGVDQEGLQPALAAAERLEAIAGAGAGARGSRAARAPRRTPRTRPFAAAHSRPPAPAAPAAPGRSPAGRGDPARRASARPAAAAVPRQPARGPR